MRQTTYVVLRPVRLRAPSTNLDTVHTYSSGTPSYLYYLYSTLSLYLSPSFHLDDMRGTSKVAD
jgi:hypothetical protein